jgi:lia operon protein LiaF
MVRSRGRWLGFVLIVVGVIFLLDSTGIVEMGDLMSTYWPLLLVLWGAVMLWRPGVFRRREAAPPPVTSTVTGSGTAAHAGESLGGSNVFGDVDIRVTSPAFTGGSATTVFGDIRVDCHQGGLADGEHHLSVSGVFGDSSVIVPPGAALDITAHSLAGDVSVLDQKQSGFSPSIRFTTPGFDGAPKRLRLTVSQVFGDIDVRR